MFGPSKEAVLKNNVLNALKTVDDPDLKKSLVELGMIKDLTVTPEGKVSFEIMLTTTACPLKAKIQQDAHDAAASVEGVTAVNAIISAQTLAPQAPKRNPIPGIKNIIAISSGKGGVGKTTASVNLACALQQNGAKVGILDSDIYGPNVPLMMGLQNSVIKEKTADNKLKPPVSHEIKVMSMAFLVKEDQPVVWRGPLLDRVIKQFFFDTGWEELDYLIVDLPPGTGDAQLTLIEAVPLQGAVIVTTPQDVAILDSKKGLSMFKNAQIPVIGVIENMSYYIHPGTTEKVYLFGQGGGSSLAKLLDVPFLGEIPLNPEVRINADKGLPIVVAQPDSEQARAFHEIAQKIIASICARGIAQQPELTTV
jgi:ATP-binding protein involved in chromosome partitioning